MTQPSPSAGVEPDPGAPPFLHAALPLTFVLLADLPLPLPVHPPPTSYPVRTCEACEPREADIVEACVELPISN